MIHMKQYLKSPIFGNKKKQKSLYGTVIIYQLWGLVHLRGGHYPKYHTAGGIAIQNFILQGGHTMKFFMSSKIAIS